MECRQAVVQSCVVDPCPCSSGLRRSDRGQASSFKSHAVDESATSALELLERFAEGQHVLSTNLYLDSHRILAGPRC